MTTLVSIILVLLLSQSPDAIVTQQANPQLTLPTPYSAAA